MIACVAGGILVPRERRGRHAKWAAKLRGIYIVFHRSSGSAAKTIQHSHAYPASYAG